MGTDTLGRRGMDTPEGGVREGPPDVREGVGRPPPRGPKAPTYVLSYLALSCLVSPCRVVVCVVCLVLPVSRKHAAKVNTVGNWRSYLPKRHAPPWL